MLESRNPLDKNFNTSDDKALVRKALDGSRKALNELLETHNMFIYNISIKMIGDIEQAKDLTQDILVKITANLSKYNPEKGEFRSWLYRMAFNHILDHKKSSTEKKIKSFSELFQTLDQMVDEPLSEETGFLDDNHPYTNEVKVKCTSGMLMCLSREQRLLYIIGDLFQIDHNLGAEIFDISKENFRKKLSRTRKELHQWMHNKCGLVNKDNPCRCAKKTKGFIRKQYQNECDKKIIKKRELNVN